MEKFIAVAEEQNKFNKMISFTTFLIGSIFFGSLAFIVSTIWCGYDKTDETDTIWTVCIFTVCGFFWIATIPALVLAFLGSRLFAIGKRLREGKK